VFKTRRRLIFAFLILLVGATPFAFRAIRTHYYGNYEIKGHQRHIRLDGQDNFRDLGGYQTSDGRTVKWGQIYRAGQLSKLSRTDISRLRSLKICTVIDFRGQSEVEKRGTDLLPEGVRRISLPIAIKSDGSAKKEKEEKSSSSDSPDSSVSGKELMRKMTRSIMLDRPDVYSAMIRELIVSQNRPLLFHCTAGKDRTGVGAAIILTLLGVPWETVREDYLLSNVYRKKENERDLKDIRKDIAKKKGIPAAKVDMSTYEALYYVEAEYLDAAYQEVISTYGSMESYLQNALGISDEMISKLQNELLE
jgi:protein-tyrosine phosphatase